MPEIPAVPPEIDKAVRDSELLQVLRGTPGFEQFLSSLDELRGLNHLDILSSTDQASAMLAIGEGRALAKVRRLVDDRIATGRELTSQFDASTEAFHRRKTAERGAYTARPASGPRRSFESV